MTFCRELFLKKLFLLVGPYDFCHVENMDGIKESNLRDRL